MNIPKSVLVSVAAAFALAFSAGVSLAASDYVGKYKTDDTQGKPMEITLSEDGTATGQRADESLSGKWKENAKNVAVIIWEDGWITRLSKKGDTYKKVAFEKGKPEAAVKGTAEKTE